MVDVDREQFEELVAAALDELPAEIANVMDNVAIFIEDEPPPGEDLLGLYEGVPLTERSGAYVLAVPDRITIFRLPVLASCSTAAEVKQQVQVTVLHEIAHHFGIDDPRLHDLGYA
jgi:predicted Zn-dependent protease with MMP-like domain